MKGTPPFTQYDTATLFLNEINLSVTLPEALKKSAERAKGTKPSIMNLA
jgi:hypothetical protein